MIAPPRLVRPALATFLVTVGCGAPAVSQTVDAPTPHARSIAAGYRAGMLCSALFNAGRSPAEIEAWELAGIDPDYAASVDTPRIDRARGVVEVGWSDSLPPRRAEWRPARGCTTRSVGAAAGSASAQSPTPPAGADTRRWPIGDAGIAPRPSPALDTAVARAFSDDYGGRTAGVVVVRDGRIVAERYADGFGPFVSNRTWSVAKTIAGMVVGHAQHRGLVNVDAPVALSEWGGFPPDDRRATLTFDQLLRMASGLHSPTAGNRTDLIYFGGGSVRQHAANWPLEVAPGTRFRYANNDTLLAIRGLRIAMGDDDAFDGLIPAFLDRLGMRHTVAERDPDGDYILSSQVWATARDLARLGLFMLQDGVWQGERLLPAGWMAASLRPSGPQPARGPGYGRTLWLHGRGGVLPADAYAAQGNRGQWILVVPSAGTVIVRRGEDATGDAFDGARFAADILDALR